MRIRAAVAAGLALVAMILVAASGARETVARAAGSAQGAGAAAAGSAAGGAIKDELIGTWRLDSRTIRQRDGSESFDPKYGPHPVGYISYDRTGHMSVQFMRPERDKSAGVEGYEAYFGTYSVDEQKKTVTHHIEGHLLADRVGQDLVRGVEIQGDKLTLVIRSPGPGNSGHGSNAANGKPATNFNHFTRMK